MAIYDGSEIFVEFLTANGVKNIFYNPGFDVVPLLSAVARYKAANKPSPAAVMCLDESTALNAAHGNYMVSGLPQVVLVHAELGTQQLGGAIQQAWWGRVPVIICAANMTSPGRLNWKGEPYDQGSMLRNCVKWDHNAGEDENFYDVLCKAFQIAVSDPMGPVYLTYPLNTLLNKTEIANVLAVKKDKLPEIDTDALNKASDLLLQADNPLIMTSYSGRNSQTVPALIELAEAIGARVAAFPVRINFPSSHPLCAPEPNDGMQSGTYFLSSDVVLAIDFDIPYAYPASQPGPDIKIIHIDIDFVKQGQPLWNKKADISIRADSGMAIPALTRIITGKLTPDRKALIRKHYMTIQDEHRKTHEEWRIAGKNAAGMKPISSEWLAYCINDAIDEDAIIVDQTIIPSGSVARQIRRIKPGTLLGCAGGTIGWALGAALGAKLAAPEKQVVALMGDGAFVYGCPTATLWPAGYYKAPFLSVIFNNQAYGAIRTLFQGSWKEGINASLISPSPDYAMTAQACGAFGRVVEDASDVTPSLREAMANIRHGKPAVLDVRVE